MFTVILLEQLWPAASTSISMRNCLGGFKSGRERVTVSRAGFRF